MTPRLSRRDVLKLAALLSATMTLRPRPGLADAAATGRPNIIVLVFDTLSAGHTSLHGYPRATTPNLVHFARRATVFNQHYAAGNFTTPGTASLLTGTYPWSHRAMQIQGTVLDAVAQRNVFTLLSAAGYYCLAFSHNLVVRSLFDQFRSAIGDLVDPRDVSLLDMSFAERFFPNDVTAAIHGEGLFSRRGEGVSSSLFLYQLYRLVASIQTSRVDRARSDDFPRGVPRAPGLLFRLEDAINWAIRQVEELPRPFFAYLHFLPPHDPYNARSEFVGRFDDGWSPVAKPDHPLGPGLPRQTLDDYRRQYDEFVAYVDAEFGRLVNELDGKGLLTSTNLFVTSDHGEMFERGIWEHITPVLFQPLIHIPLIASTPGQMSARRVDTATSCVDLLPTLLDIAGVERPAWLEGDILPTFGRSTAAGSTPTAKRVVYALEAKRNPKNAPLRTRTAAIVSGGHKLVHYRGYEGYDDAAELYDVEHDPEELNDLYASNPDLAREMRATLAAQLSAHDAVGES